MKGTQDKFLPDLVKFFHILEDRFRETIHPEVKISLPKELESINVGGDPLIGEVQFYVPNSEWLELIESLLGSGLVPRVKSDPRLVLEFLISSVYIQMMNPIRENEFHRFYQRSTGKEKAEYLIYPQLYINQVGSDVWYSGFDWPIRYQEGAGYYFTNVQAGTFFKEIRYSADTFQNWEAIPVLELFKDPDIQLISSRNPEHEVAFFPRSAVSPVPTNPELQMVWGLRVSYLYYRS